ncbi:MAG: hypothetical protein HFJ25_03965 [Clostridia bacterium]|nr:hypothetical protein [Clostridia bacterium]
MKSEKEFIDEFWMKCRDKEKCNDSFFKKNIYRDNNYLLVLKSCAMFMLCFIVISSVLGAVYAGIISYNTGRPIIECLGINFSNEKYDEYKTNIMNQVAENGNSTVRLVSGVYDNGFTILEFDVNLSEKDREYLMLDQNVITNEQLKEAEETNNFLRLQCKDLKNTVGIVLNSEPKIEYNRNLEEIQLYVPRNDNIIIDDKGYNLSMYQDVKKVSDYQYKIYQSCIITDEFLNGRNDFTIKFDNIVLRNKPEDKSIGIATVQPIENIRCIPLEGELNITLSSKRISENTEIIEPKQAISKYANITKKVDKVIVTPLQIVAQITTTIDEASSYSLQNTNNDKYVGNQEYEIYNSEGDRINCETIEMEKRMVFSDGTIEKIDRQEVAPKRQFINGKMEMIHYVIIERKNELKDLTIIPTLQKYEFIENDYVEKQIELNEIKINININN